jgi:hypothetical protein
VAIKPANMMQTQCSDFVMSFQIINPTNFIIYIIHHTQNIEHFYHNVKCQDIINKHGVQLCQKSYSEKQRQVNKVIGGISESCLLEHPLKM